ncbi:MAG: hypothetical protein LAT84_06990 [Balneolia bacterium]|nr:hypothetical protein [Balneolia bacterium]
MRLFLPLFIFVALFSCSVGVFQKAGAHAGLSDPPSDPVSFLQQFSALQTDLPRERIYLHTDRPSYFPGDRVWFSAYVLGGSANAFSGISTVLYAELYDDEGNRVDRSIVRLDEGRGKGVLTLNESNVQPGMYELVAFTAWGLNFGQSYAFRKPLLVHDAENMMAAEFEGAESVESITFFPEGGALIPGAESLIGFTAVDSEGKPAAFEGGLFSGEERIADISTSVPGYGKFSLKPESGQAYSMEVNGRFFEIPVAETGSSAMRLKTTRDAGGQFVLQLQSADTGYNGSVVVMGHVRGEIYHAGEIFMQDGMGMTWVSPDLFPSGIVRFVALDAAANVLSTRDAFNVNPLDEAEVEIAVENSSVERRGRVEPIIRLRDHEGNPVRGVASVTIYDESAAPRASNGDGTIRDALLFSTELDNSLWYSGPSFFSASNDLREVLLLTSAAGSFTYGGIGDEESITLQSFPERGFTISGQVRRGLLTSGVAGAAVVVSIGEDDEQLVVLEADDDGNFAIDELDIRGVERLQVRGPDTRGIGQVRVSLNPQFEHLPVLGRKLPLAVPGEPAPPLAEGSVSMAERTSIAQVDTESFIIAETDLDAVTVTASRIDREEISRRLATGDIGGSEIRVEDDPVLQSFSILEVIQRLPGVSVVDENINVRVGQASVSGGSEPLILLDGTEITADFLRGLRASDVATVIVLRRPDELARFGARGGNGVVSIRSVRGRQIERPDSQILVAFAEGFSDVPPFLSPRYGGALRDDERTDARITLHFEPSIEVRRNGTPVLFWTGDIPGTYRIEVSGITEDGVPFSGYTTIEVE